MRVASCLYKQNGWLSSEKNNTVNSDSVQLVLAFGEKSLITGNQIYNHLRQKYPAAAIVICSTAGEIYGSTVLDETVTVTAVEFEKTNISTACINITDYPDSFTAGQSLVAGFDKEQLTYMLVISDGNKVNGSELVKGINDACGKNVLVTGGLAGDAANFASTLVGLNGINGNGNIVGVAFYGDAIRVGHGCMGGWDMFGPERTVTRSAGNVLHEIDGINALQLYTEYLGSFAAQLPGSALLFPLSVELPGTNTQVVRTILSIDNENETMTFAGDVPVNARIRFMRANFDRIVNAAAEAAAQTLKKGLTNPPALALLISCVGRKLILQKRAEEEVEAVNESFGGKTILTGFYSYGEISPLLNETSCQLHNQTMTITTFDEQ
jgi:hypothetical protein